MLIFKSDFLISDVLNLFNHLIQADYLKKYSIIDFLKIVDKISEIFIFNIILKDKISDSQDSKELSCHNLKNDRHN